MRTTDTIRISRAIAGGLRDENQLTNLIFDARHPEHRGRFIQRGERAAAVEWLDIRDRLVRPALTGAATAAAAPVAPRHTSAGCAAPAQMAVDRCINPGTRACPAIPDLICVNQVDGVPFHYPTVITRDAQTRLFVITKRQAQRVQRFIPEVHAALSGFLSSMRRFGMPVEAIITYGSLYCRCISNKNELSNHSFGDAIDIVGVRWPAVGGPRSALRETIVHNFRESAQRAVLRRIDACLRLSFTRVIDYHRPDHHDHFHCDMNRRGPRRPRERVSLTFAQEALGTVLGRRLPVTGRLDAITAQALRDFSGAGAAALADDSILDRVLRDLYSRVAADR